MEYLGENKIIAEYMGYTYYPHNSELLNRADTTSNYDAGWKKDPRASMFTKHNTSPFGPRLSEDAYLCRTHKGLQYHSNWNWQIKAWAKLQKQIHEIFFKLNFEDREQLSIFEKNYLAAIDVDSPQNGLSILILTLNWLNHIKT